MVKRLFCISEREVQIERRGFHRGAPETCDRLETIGRAFVHGFNTGILRRPAEHPGALDEVALADRGFAFEGLAMNLALFDLLLPGRKRWRVACEGFGLPHAYVFAIGQGLARARLRRRIDFPLAGLSPLEASLACDGYGFHHGFFTRPTDAAHARVPRRVGPGARRGFDQGYGRALWFVHGGESRRLAAAVAALAPERHEGAWSGVGLAATYAGGVGREGLEALVVASQEYAPSLAQGAAFAAECRARAQNPAEHTDLACRVLLGVGADAGAAAARETSADLDFEDREVYETWRLRLRRRFREHELAS